MKMLIQSPEKHVIYAIDKYWFKLQKRDKWYLIIPLTVTQREDYSDIEKRPTNYTNVMIDLDKERFFLNRQNKQTKPFSSMTEIIRPSSNM